MPDLATGIYLDGVLTLW